MGIKFIVNERVMFIPGQRKLILLTSREEEILLSVPACRAFMILIERKGNAVSHETLMEQVWGANNQVVTMNTLYQNISLLRRCLKRAGISPKSIRTYSKVGFSFNGEIQIIRDEFLTGVKQDDTQTIAENEASELSGGNGITFSSSSSKAFNKAKEVASHFYYIIILTVIVFLFAYKERLSMEFTIEQVKVARFNNCPVYLDKGNQNVNIDSIITSLKSSGISCTTDQYIYLTKNFYIDGIIVLLCGSPSNKTLVCASNVELPDT